ncbi:MAG: hypothetical protein Greene041619_906 [Candidatus Peregrinibacteria bacterium Greene0416_19]|nr:MAG: hypothetical protein Greene041619_906 [Candidatus Peregrinibacteria bacterium Greene0416_19]
MRLSIFLRRFLYALFAAPLAVIATGALYWTTATSLGYYVHKTGWEVAKILVEKGRPPTHCKKIHWLYTLTSPTVAEQRALCFYEYAKLSRDPAVCEYLMPSEYGIYCIAETQSTIKPDPECYLLKDKKLLCRINGKQEEFFWRDCESKLSDPNMKDWCIIARVTWEQNFNDCSGISPVSAHLDACFFALAQKIQDEQRCQLVKNTIRKSACGILVRAKKQHPEIFKHL